MMRNIYVVGAQCRGKTTLVNALEDHFKSNEVKRTLQQPTIIREVARTVLKEKGFTRDDLATSPIRALQLQQHILDAQLHAEGAKNKTASSNWYICDRSGLDPNVYAQLFAGRSAAEDMLESEAWQALERRMKNGIVMLCEAGCTWLIDDGIRLMPDGLDDWMRVDSFRELLDARGIAYTIIWKDVISLPERLKMVQDAIEAGNARLEDDSH
jgi:nicotinamide riboside kinase